MTKPASTDHYFCCACHIAPGDHCDECKHLCEPASTDKKCHDCQISGRDCWHIKQTSTDSHKNSESHLDLHNKGTESVKVSTDLDAQLDELLWQFATYMKRAMGGRQVGGNELNHDDAKQALTKLIADREREARIDELGKLPAFDGSEGRVRFYYTKRVTELRKEGDK